MLYAALQMSVTPREASAATLLQFNLLAVGGLLLTLLLAAVVKGAPAIGPRAGRGRICSSSCSKARALVYVGVLGGTGMATYLLVHNLPPDEAATAIKSIDLLWLCLGGGAAIGFLLDVLR